MSKALPYLLVLSLLGNLAGLFALYKAYDYRKKMILAWAQSHEWTSEFHGRPQSADQPAEGVDVVLLGASITAHWDPARHLPGHRIVNKGIDGQFASQLLLRFQHDVIDLHPKMVVIKLCEMNFAHQVPFSISQDNVKMMTALARANGIRTVVATVIPVTERYDAQKQKAINQTIHAFNQWLGEYAAANRRSSSRPVCIRAVPSRGLGRRLPLPQKRSKDKRPTGADPGCQCVPNASRR